VSHQCPYDHAVPPELSLSRNDERRLALVAQGLAGTRITSGALGLVRRLGAIQLDTISVLARSHLLVAWARLGARRREHVEGALWSAIPSTFEYWAHAACILPLEDWPLYAFRRRARRDRGRRWHRLSDADRSCAEILARLSADGPLTAHELGGAKGGGPWWDWTEEKIAVEWLLDTGVVVCTRRSGWQRVYDLAERAIPAAIHHDDFDDATCVSALVAQAGRGLGVATISELATYFNLKVAEVRSVIDASGLVPVSVEGGRAPHYADPTLLESSGASVRSRSTLLSPFDSLLWDRKRAERIFGIVHRLEAYVPRVDRVHGYYAMPVLSGGRIVGRVDPAREGTTLVARTISIGDARSVPGVARALHDAAGWVGCDSVAIERLADESMRPALIDALSR
jgi:uncharacterized protein